MNEEQLQKKRDRANKWNKAHREYRNAYMREWNARNHEKVRKAQHDAYWRNHEERRRYLKVQDADWRADARAFRDWLKDQPCMDCGKRFDPVCMDFDHRNPATKRYAVGKLWDVRVSLATIQTEVMKCDLVCANCHRIRTHRSE